MKQVKVESDRARQAEACRNREMGQLKREQLRKENIIRTLEREKQQKDVILRRKQEEVRLVEQLRGGKNRLGIIITDIFSLFHLLNLTIK